MKIGSGTAGASASAPFNHGASATITATPATGYHFVKWDDGNTTASRSVSVTAAKTYIATFAINTYKITVTSNNTDLGTVSGGGTYSHGSSATLTATPANCTCVFKQWNDGNTDNPRTVTATEAKTYTAQFVALSGNCGTTGHEADVTWSLNLCDSTLTISGTGAMANYPALNMPWKDYRTSIKSVIISDGVTTIGSSAFNGCSNLTSLTVPPSLTSVGQYAFSSCWAMESVYISDLTAWCNINFGTYDSSPFCRNGYDAIHVGGGDLYVNGTKVTTLTIPDGITEIKNDAFYGFAGITDIQFNQVTTIGNSAFHGCHGLTSITLPEGVTSIGQYGICYCSHLQSISIPASASSLGNSMVVANPALTDIYVHWTENIPAWPDNFTNKTPQTDITLHVPCGTEDLYNAADGWKDYTIAANDIASGTCGADGDNLTWVLSCDSVLTISGTGAMADWDVEADCPWYSYRTQIYTINIDEGVTTIGRKAFVFSRISSITIPNSVISIGSVAFGHSNYLEEIVLPEGLTSIGFQAFYYGNELKTVHIPSTVTSLGFSAFEGCSLLTDIYVKWPSSIPDWPTKFSNTNGVTLHVPCGTEALYEAATGWKKYTIEGEGQYTVTVQTETGDTTQGTVSITINP